MLSILQSRSHVRAQTLLHRSLKLTAAKRPHGRNPLLGVAFIFEKQLTSQTIRRAVRLSTTILNKNVECLWQQHHLCLVITLLVQAQFYGVTCDRTDPPNSHPPHEWCKSHIKEEKTCSV